MFPFHKMYKKVSNSTNLGKRHKIPNNLFNPKQFNLLLEENKDTFLMPIPNTLNFAKPNVILF